MKQKDIVKAYRAIEKYSQKTVPLKTSYALYKTKNLIKDQVDFQTEKEKEIFDKYHPTMEEGGLHFETPEQAEEFAKEFDAMLTELGEIEVGLDIVKPQIPLDQNLEMSMEDIEALEPFIDFVE